MWLYYLRRWRRLCRALQRCSRDKHVRCNSNRCRPGGQSDGCEVGRPWTFGCYAGWTPRNVCRAMLHRSRRKALSRPDRAGDGCSLCGEAVGSVHLAVRQTTMCRIDGDPGIRVGQKTARGPTARAGCLLGGEVHRRPGSRGGDATAEWSLVGEVRSPGWTAVPRVSKRGSGARESARTDSLS